MHKIVVFDLDGTLCPVGKGMTSENIERLRALEGAGYTVVICSGKPSYYLAGFMRQIGLCRPILIGENGATTQYGIDLPPKKHLAHPVSPRAKAQMLSIKEKIDAACGEDIWYQPNAVALTPFPKWPDVFSKIEALLDRERDNLDALAVFRHIDSFDFTPCEITKYSALEILAGEEGLSRTDFIAVGDGVNDIPMFDFADISVLIGNGIDYAADLCFDAIGDAIDHILSKSL